MSDTLPLTRGSYSQIDTWLSCPRKRWFTWSQKMRAKPTRNQAMGTALHWACEEFVRSPEQISLDEVFSHEGWHIITERDGTRFTLNEEERQLIQTRVEQMLHAGILRRKPGQQIVEHKVTWEDESRGIGFVGYIDLLEHGPNTEDWAVWDYKTSKSKRWLASGRADLWKNVQLALYAWFAYELAKEMYGLHLEQIRIGHKQAVWYPTGKNAEMDSVREVDLPDYPILEAKRVWQEHRKHLLNIRGEDARFVELTEDDWEKVPPFKREGACQAYGGCTFGRICAHMQTPAQWRIENGAVRKPAALPPSPALQMAMSETQMQSSNFALPTNPTGAPAGGGFAQAPAGGGGFAQAPQPSQAAPSPTPGAMGIEQIVSLQQGQVFNLAQVNAPWADPSCSTCGGSGIVNGGVCLGCGMLSGNTGRIKAENFNVQVGADGSAIFSPLRDIQLDPNGVEIVSQEAPQQQAQQAQQPAQEQAAPEPVQETAPPEEPEEKPAKGSKGAGRSRTIGLYIGISLASKKNAKDINAWDLLLEVVEQVAPGTSWFAQDVWKRREALENWVMQNPDFFGGKHIFSPVRPHGDEAALVNALRTHATRVMMASAV